MYGIAYHECRLQCSLFDTLARSVLSYGYEVWAVEAEHKDLKQLEGLHIEFLRSNLGLPKRGPPTRSSALSLGATLSTCFG